MDNNSNLNCDQETLDILRLIRSENIGIRTFNHLINLYKNASEALKHLKDFARRGGKKDDLYVCSKEDALEELRCLDLIGAALITYKDPQYPQMLLNIQDYPPVLTIIGNTNLLNKKCIAVVGSRNASINGKILANKIVSEFSKNNIITVSGLARGIDTAAHKGAVPNTIAVIAGGIDHIYPAENKELYQEIAKNGIIVAELKIGSKPVAQHFPQRNRIIAGMSAATLVIEASLNSGSLITARYAIEYGREVFAVPGFPLDPRAQGANRLIKEGAYLVESVEEILENIPNNFNINDRYYNAYSIEAPELKQMYQNLEITNKMREDVLECASSNEIYIDQISNMLDLPLRMIYMIVLELEIAGKIDRVSNSGIIRTLE